MKSFNSIIEKTFRNLSEAAPSPQNNTQTQSVNPASKLPDLKTFFHNTTNIPDLQKNITSVINKMKTGTDNSSTILTPEEQKAHDALVGYFSQNSNNTPTNQTPVV